MTDLSVYPNPLSSMANIEFNLIEANDVKVEVYDVVGKLNQIEVYNNLGSGEHRLTVNASDLSKGMYLLKLTAGETELTKRIVIE